MVPVSVNVGDVIRCARCGGKFRVTQLGQTMDRWCREHQGANDGRGDRREHGQDGDVPEVRSEAGRAVQDGER